MASQIGVKGPGAGVYPVKAYNNAKAKNKCSKKSTYKPNTDSKNLIFTVDLDD